MNNNQDFMRLTDERMEARQILRQGINRESLLRIDLDIVSMFQDNCEEKNESLARDNVQSQRDHNVAQPRRLVGFASRSESSSRNHAATSSTDDRYKTQIRSDEDMDKVKETMMTSDGSILLPLDFKPLPYSVIVGKGKISRNVIGNRRLRVLASNYLTKYDEASADRDTKSEIVSAIIRTIRAACPLGPFIKRGKDGRWYEVNENVAREKVGYTFRDLLGTKYKSSSKAKQAMRRQQKYGTL